MIEKTLLIEWLDSTSNLAVNHFGLCSKQGVSETTATLALDALAHSHLPEVPVPINANVSQQLVEPDPCSVDLQTEPGRLGSISSTTLPHGCLSCITYVWFRIEGEIASHSCSQQAAGITALIGKRQLQHGRIKRSTIRVRSVLNGPNIGALIGRLGFW